VSNEGIVSIDQNNRHLVDFLSAKHCPLVALQGHPAEPLFHVFGHFLLQSAPNYKNRRLRINWRGSCMSGGRKTMA